MKRAALFVGVDRYEDADIRPLKYAEKDAAELHGFFKYVGGYEDVRLLLSPDSDEVLDTARAMVERLESGGLFVFYFAGHGVEYEGRHLLLFPKARYRRLRYYHHTVPLDLLKEETTRSGRHRFLVLDACRSDLVSGVRGEEQGLRDVEAIRKVATRAPGAGALGILCSCDEGQQARELDALGHGMFTEVFLRVCREQLKREGEVSLSDSLVEALEASLRKLAPEDARGQRPWLQKSGALPPLLTKAGLRTSVDPKRSRPRRRRPPVPPESSASASAPPVWYVAGGSGEMEGPFSAAEVLERIRSGEMTGRSMVWSSDLGVWTPASAAPAFASACASVSSPVVVSPPPPPPAPVEEGPVEGRAWTVPDLGMEFVYVPPGSFRMGSNDGWGDEKPVHRVKITRGYWLGKYEVTNGEYRRFLEESGYDGSGDADSDCLKHFKGDSDMPTEDRYPICWVSWKNAVAFCKWLTDRERAAGRLPSGYVYRLPTEAEWEYAARGGPKSRGYKYSGSNDLDAVGWYNDNSGGKTHPVGQKQANELGLYDMSGNVWEWCLDWYDDEYYRKSPDTDPVNTSRASRRVKRGGGWRSGAGYCRAANRVRCRPDVTRNYLGFRACLAPSSP